MHWGDKLNHASVFIKDDKRYKAIDFYKLLKRDLRAATMDKQHVVIYNKKKNDKKQIAKEKFE